MSFTRSAAGVANYKLFFDADLVVFVEGKREEQNSDDQLLADEVFYAAIIASAIPNKKIKIKCVGNCDDVAAHVNKLAISGEEKGFGIVDRDSEGILYSYSGIPKRLLMTKGALLHNPLAAPSQPRRVALGRLCLDEPDQDPLPHNQLV